MICIVKLFNIIFKELDVFMFVMHLEVKISPWDTIEGLTSDAVIHLSHQSFVIFHFFS